MPIGTAGEKRKRITIQYAVRAADGHGGTTVTGWATRCVVNAHERPLSGSEAIRAQQVTAVLSSVWEIWFRSDISVKDRLKFGSRICQIESYLDPHDRQAELYLFTSEVQS